MLQTILYIVLPVAGIVLGWTIRWIYARFQLSAAEQKAERVKQDAIKEAEAFKKRLSFKQKNNSFRTETSRSGRTTSAVKKFKLTRAV